jgi:hypothetical protein
MIVSGKPGPGTPRSYAPPQTERTGHHLDQSPPSTSTRSAHPWPHLAVRGGWRPARVLQGRRNAKRSQPSHGAARLNGVRGVPALERGWRMERSPGSRSIRFLSGARSPR